jgi:hypothetical protein
MISRNLKVSVTPSRYFAIVGIPTIKLTHIRHSYKLRVRQISRSKIQATNINCYDRIFVFSLLQNNTHLLGKKISNRICV